MRTTIRIDDRLLAAAKEHALRSGKTLTALIEEALRETLARRRKPRTGSRRVRLKTVDGNGLQPGVDLDDSSSLLDVMDGRR